MKMYAFSLGQVEIKPIAVIYKEIRREYWIKMHCNHDEYENIVRFKKYLRDGLDDDNIDIKFSSKFVSFSLLAALALLI